MESTEDSRSTSRWRAYSGDELLWVRQFGRAWDAHRLRPKVAMNSEIDNNRFRVPSVIYYKVDSAHGLKIKTGESPVQLRMQKRSVLRCVLIRSVSRDGVLKSE